MSSLAKKSDKEYIATEVSIDDDFLLVILSDGREIKTPLEFFPRLRNASKAQRKKFEIIGLGTSIHWPEIDEDISVRGIVFGTPARF